ncbi:MAG: hypothetical protein ABFD46_00660, partial [Armatimonadota bacterium]
MCFYKWKFAMYMLMFLAVIAVFGIPAYATDRNAALLRSGLEKYDSALVDSLSKELSSAGYTVREISLDNLCDTKFLSGFDLLVLPDAGSLPVGSARSVSEYLSQGKDIIALNAPAWQKSLLNVSGQWMTLRDYQIKRASVEPESTFLSFAPDKMPDLSRSSGKMDTQATYELSNDSPVPGGHSLHVAISNYSSWDTYGFIPKSNPFAGGKTLTIFTARGDESTTQLSVEWQENDGSRWIAVVPLESTWKRFVLEPKDFKYWESAPGRGGNSDCFNPEKAAKLSFGLAESHTKDLKYGRHEYWVGSFGTEKMSPDYRQILDAVNPSPLEIITPPYKFFDCKDISKLYVRKDQVIVTVQDIPNASVVRSVQPRPSGGGFDKGRSWRWIPLIEAKTAKGEWRGVPAAMMIHTDGPY